MFLFFTVVQAIVAAALVAVILMQRSEGGGLGIGGSPSGMMSARGAADFLTRSTKWLAVLFVVLSIVLAAMAVEGAGGSIDTTLGGDAENASATGYDPLAGSPSAPAGGEEPAAPSDDPLAE